MQRTTGRNCNKRQRKGREIATAAGFLFEKLQQMRTKRRHFLRNCNIFMFLINHNGHGREIATFLQTATANTFIY